MSERAVEVQGRAVGRAGKLQRGDPSRPRDVVHLVVALVEHAGGVHPPFQILAAIHARRPDVFSDRQRDRSPRALELVRDLGAARGSAHDQDATVGELARIAIGLGCQRRDRRRHAGGEARHPRDVARPRGQHDGLAPPVAAVRAHKVSRVRAAHRGDSGMGSHRRRDRLCIGRDEVDDLRQRPIAVRVVAVIAESPAAGSANWGSSSRSESHLSVRQRMGDFATLQQNMIDRALREAAAHRKSRMPRADNDGGDDVNRAVSSWRDQAAAAINSPRP